ncbi:MAG: type pilus modification protein PilV, partial [Pseudomonadota bacterium]
NREAYLRTQASILAHDLTERMRANSLGARAGAYSMADKGSASGDDPIEWVGHLADALPEGDATVTTGVSAGALNVTISIRWVDGGTPYTFTNQTTI